MSEKTYPVEDVFRGTVYTVPESLLSNYRDAREPTTGKPQYRLLEDIEGAQILDNGSYLKTKIPADKWQETARESSPFVLPFPGLEKVLKEHERTRKIGKIVKDQPAADIAMRSFASGMTLGGSTALLDLAYGQEYEEIRAMTTRERIWPHFAGRAASVIGLGLVPIPGLSTAMKAKGIGNVGNIFELSALGASKVGAKVKGTGYLADFARRFGTTTTFAAIAEAPLSLAMASADIVDHNQEWTMEAVASEAATQYLLGVTIGAATGFTYGALAQVARGGKAATGFLGDIKESLVRGGVRNITRRHFRGKYGGIGDAIELQAGRISSKSLPGAPDPRPSRWSNFFGGKDFDELGYARHTKTVGGAINDLRYADSPAKVRRATETLMFNVEKDNKFYSQLAMIRENADQMVEAKRVAQLMIQDGKRMSDLASQVTFQHPKKVTSSRMKGLPIKLKHELQAAGAGKVEFSSNNHMKMLDETLNIRRTIGPAKRADLDKLLVEAYPGIDRHLPVFDKFDRSARMVRTLADEYGTEALGVRGAYGLIGPEDGSINAFRTNIRGMEGPFRELANKKVNGIVDSTPFFSGERPIFVRKNKQTFLNIDTKLNDLRGGVDALGAANTTTASLLVDSKPLFKRAPPVTQAELLGAQIETVVDQKRRIIDAIKFAAVRGGGGRHTAIFGGVYVFRDMQSFDEKQQAFYAYHQAISQAAGTPESMQEIVGQVVGPLAEHDMQGGVALAGTLTTALAYLNQQMPQSADPMIGPEDYSAAEIENFLEAVGAVMSPESVIATASDGSTTEQAVDAVRTVYPELWTEAVLDIAEFVYEFGDKLDNQVLLGFDTFTGYALGVTDVPSPDLMLQPPHAQTRQQARSIGGPENRRMDFMQMTTPAQKLSAM